MNENVDTLLLRFAGPLQSWGSSSRFSIRMSEREPTKSGVIGFCASAMGRRREDSIDDLCSLGFGVRIDQPGELISDFHMLHTHDEKEAFLSRRYYLSDAIFLVGISGSKELLRDIERAINQPAFPLFLGRRSCPPSGEVVLGIREGTGLEDALLNEPWLASEWYRKKQASQVMLEVVVDVAFGDDGGSFLRNDVPVSFSQTYRKYRRRAVKSNLHAVVMQNPDGKVVHDAMEAF